MLDSMRSFATTWVGKIIGGFLVLGLAGFGVSGVLTGIGSNTVARVGSEDITIRDFQRVYNSQLNAAASQRGAVPTAQEALALGIPSAAINRLASDAALNALGRDFGLGASDERLGQMLREDPNFGGTLGNFDAANFQRALQQNGFTENEYFKSQTDAVRRQQIAIAIFGGAKIPEAAQKLINRYGSDTRTIDYFVLSSTGLLPPADPTEGEIVAYLAENQTTYRTIPTRTAQLMVLSPEAIAAGIEVNVEDVTAQYERTKATFLRIETRDVHQVILSSDTLVRWFEMGIESGKSFDTIIEESSLPVTDLGTLTKAQIIDTTLADAAFELEDGAYTLIPAAQGMRAVMVTNIVPGGQQSLDDVRDQVEERLKNRQARDSYIDILDQIEELRAAFRPLDEIASRYGLDLTDVPLTASGAALSAIDAIPVDGHRRVATAIFAAEQGNLAPTVTLGASRNVWFDLLQIDPARDQTIDEVRDQINETMLTERTNDALLTQVDQVIANMTTGQPFADVAVALNQFPQLSQAFTRRGIGSAVINGNVAAAAFGGGAGFFGSAQNSDGDYVIFQVVDVTPSTGEIEVAAREFVDSAMIDSLYGGFIGALRDDAGVNINQGVLSQILALDGTQ